MNTHTSKRTANHLIMSLALILATGAVYAGGAGKAPNKPNNRMYHDQSLPMPIKGNTPTQEAGPGPSKHQDKLGNFEIQDIKSPRDSASGQATQAKDDAQAPFKQTPAPGGDVQAVNNKNPELNRTQALKLNADDIQGESSQSRKIQNKMQSEN